MSLADEVRRNMNFIIFDLEATCWQNRPFNKVSEIIEIGAYKLNGYGEILGEFNKFVKPVLNPILSPFCMELTSIEQKYVDRAEIFPEVLELFWDWIGYYDEEDYLLCSWGKYDKTMLMQDSRLHKIEEDWAESHINIKQQYKKIKGLPKPYGLKKAVEKEGFEFDGIHHRAISDAHNLAKIFVKYIDDWEY